METFYHLHSNFEEVEILAYPRNFTKKFKDYLHIFWWKSMPKALFLICLLQYPTLVPVLIGAVIDNNSAMACKMYCLILIFEPSVLPRYAPAWMNSTCHNSSLLFLKLCGGFLVLHSIPDAPMWILCFSSDTVNSWNIWMWTHGIYENRPADSVAKDNVVSFLAFSTLHNSQNLVCSCQFPPQLRPHSFLPTLPLTKCYLWLNKDRWFLGYRRSGW